ncbi:MAG: glycosyltransferase, partial [Myxococcales bacterium]|nr:glycosyltransferase [Myxococcales bacterium]
MREKKNKPEPRVLLPKITIITPSFNQAEYLEECIVSVLAQKYPNLEYIVMDGGSTDGSADIIRRYAHKLTYWQSRADGGQASAINAGFARSSGELMGWLNSDDKLHPHALWKVALQFHRHPSLEWLTSRAALWGETGDVIYIQPGLPHFSRRKHLDLHFNKPFIPQDSTFWRRALWDKAGGMLEPALRLALDTELWVRFFRHANLHVLNALLGGYRLTGKNIAVLGEEELRLQAIAIMKAERRRLAGSDEPSAISAAPCGDAMVSQLPKVLESTRRELDDFMVACGVAPMVNWAPCWHGYFKGLSALLKGSFAEGQFEVVAFIAGEIAYFDGVDVEQIGVVRQQLQSMLHALTEILQLNDEGSRLLAAGDTLAALRNFHAALSLSPSHKDPITLTNLGACFAQAESIADAERFF